MKVPTLTPENFEVIEYRVDKLTAELHACNSFGQKVAYDGCADGLVMEDLELPPGRVRDIIESNRQSIETRQRRIASVIVRWDSALSEVHHLEYLADCSPRHDGYPSAISVSRVGIGEFLQGCNSRRQVDATNNGTIFMVPDQLKEKGLL